MFDQNQISFREFQEIWRQGMKTLPHCLAQLSLTMSCQLRTVLKIWIPNSHFAASSHHQITWCFVLNLLFRSLFWSFALLQNISGLYGPIFLPCLADQHRNRSKLWRWQGWSRAGEWGLFSHLHGIFSILQIMWEAYCPAPHMLPERRGWEAW